ncbi:MAG: trypsin-like peptidase domain-containing protein [Planctomycetales bacterium]|nr:trypsin-like peptidase domain-containing protein [Planctomycetales bacterium]
MNEHEESGSNFARDDLSPRDAYGTPFHGDGLEVGASETLAAANWPEASNDEVLLVAGDREARRTAEPSRLFRFLWMLALLLSMMLIPEIVKRVSYSYTYGVERARADVAREQLHRDETSPSDVLSATSRHVAKAVGPSVVHLRTVRLASSTPGEFSFTHDGEEFGQGSGVILDNDGFIVTNSHVVLDAQRITAHLVDGREIEAKVIGADTLTDLAVLKIDAKDLVASPWGDSERLEAGDMVWAVGSPFGLDRSVTFGIVSATLRRGVTGSRYQDFLQTDAAINPGNSGGPLVDRNGRVVGINTAIVGASYRGIGFAIPSSIAQDVYQRLKSTGRVSRGWLGVALDELGPEDRLRLDLDESVEGILIQRVVPGSPAAKAGLQAMDIILEWDGQKVTDPLLLTRLVAATKIGAHVPVKVLSQKKETTLEIEISERPAKYD